MSTYTIKCESHKNIFVAEVMDRNYDALTFISKYLYFKKASSLNPIEPAITRKIFDTNSSFDVK